MRNVGASTRLRAWFLRTFRGRSAGAAAWTEELPVSAGAPESFEIGRLRIDVTPTGLKSAGINKPSVVFDVRVSRDEGSQNWSSRYGLTPRQASARGAADHALDELDEIWRDRAGWRARVTEGMSDDEVEAMEDSPSFQADARAAEWVGPELEPLRDRRGRDGSWLGETS
jgi:hypothetical protein